MIQRLKSGAAAGLAPGSPAVRGGARRRPPPRPNVTKELRAKANAESESCQGEREEARRHGHLAAFEADRRAGKVRLSTRREGLDYVDGAGASTPHTLIDRWCRALLRRRRAREELRARPTKTNEHAASYYNVLGERHAWSEIKEEFEGD